MTIIFHLPSGVVEVLEVPEEAGLFLLVAGRVLVQDAGHAWSRGAHGRGTVSRGTVCGCGCGVADHAGACTRRAGERARWLCSSALDVREHFTRRRRRRRRRRPLHRYHRRRAVIYAAADPWTDAHTPRCSRVHSRRHDHRVQSAAAARPVSRRRRTTTARRTEWSEKTRRGGRSGYLFLTFPYNVDGRATNTVYGATHKMATRNRCVGRWKNKKKYVTCDTSVLRLGVSARALGGGVQGRPDAASAVATGSEKKKTNRTLAENGEKSKFTRRSGRPFVIAQCVRIGRVAPTPPTEYCPNIKTSRAHAPCGHRTDRLQWYQSRTGRRGRCRARVPTIAATYVCFFFPRRVRAPPSVRREHDNTVCTHTILT